MGTSTKTFIAYSRKDEPLRDELQKHMSMLVFRGRVEVWYDRRIEAGTDWDAEIHEALGETELFLLLVSSDFLASGYAMGVEVSTAMTMHEAGAAAVVPVILRPCDREGAPFEHLQALPKDAKPVMSWSNQDEAFSDVVENLKPVLTRLEEQRAPNYE